MTSPSSSTAIEPHSNGHELSSRQLAEQMLEALNTNGAAPEPPARAWNWRTYTGALRRRWRPMLFLGLLTFALAFWKLKPTDNTYMANSVLLLPAKTNAAATSADTLGVLGGLVRASGGSIDTQIAILISPDLVQTALAKLSPTELEAGWKTKDVKIAFKRLQLTALAGASNDIINITVIAGDPNVAIKLANGLITAFADRSQTQAGRAQSKNIALLKQQVNEAQKLMMGAKQAVRAFKEKNGIVDLNPQLQGSSQQLETLSQQVARARETMAAGIGDQTIQGDELRNKLVQDLDDARTRYQAISKDFFPTAPEALKVAQEVKRLENALKLRTDSLIAINRTRLSDSEAAYSQAKSRAAQMPKIELQFTDLDNKRLLLEDTYKQLADRYTDLTIGKNAQIETATALALADTAVSANRSWFVVVGVALFGALALAGLLGLVLESLDHSIHSTDDLKATVAAPVLGTMPLLKKGEERRLAHVSTNQPSAGVLLEACRILRSNLVFASENSLHSVLLTSADPGEGKSLSAFNLATVMALDGRRVLLLDCDLRRPSQHILANLPLEPGLSNVISGETDWKSAIQATGIQNLSLLSAGALPENPPELLGSEANRQLLAQLRQEFDLIVLDSPPIASLTDAQVLSSLADGTLLVVAADTTEKGHIERAQAMLRHVGARLLGVVFNKAKEHQDAYVWQSYYTGYLTEALPVGQAKNQSS